MPRRPRIHVPGGYYHVILRGNHRQDIFYTEDDRLRLDGFIADALEPTGVRIHAYCWMTNHIHMLCQVSDQPLGRFMQRIGTRYARAVQRQVPTTGHLFENRYYSVIVDADAYFRQLLRYIHLNPVRAGLVADPSEYPWSSQRAYLDMAASPWLEVDFGLSMFGADRDRARRRLGDFVAAGVGAPRDPALYAAHPREPRVLGDDAFLARVVALAQPVRPSVSLEDIAVAVCQELQLDLADVRCPSQRRTVSRARGLITARAIEARAASLSEVARWLDRDISSVSRAAQRYG